MNYLKQWDKVHTERELFGDVLKPIEEFFSRRFSTEAAGNTKVLDVGCSAGTNSLWLARQGFKVCAFDGSNAAISRLLCNATKTRMLNFPSVMCADMTKRWPYFSNSFDVVLDVRSLENLTLDDFVRAYSEIKRVLKPGGKFVSLTASNDRPDKHTTCGTVLKLLSRDVFDLVTKVGMRVDVMKREFEGTLEDWFIIARRP